MKFIRQAECDMNLEFNVYAGEKDIAVVKLQNLRPSLIWTDGQWMSWKELSLWEVQLNISNFNQEDNKF
jgi:hypothetical protein